MAKVLCVSNENGKIAITVGKLYEVLVNGATTYKVTNDKGKESAYLKKHFGDIVPDAAPVVAKKPIVVPAAAPVPAVQAPVVVNEIKPVVHVNEVHIFIAIPNADVIHNDFDTDDINDVPVMFGTSLEDIGEKLAALLENDNIDNDDLFHVYELVGHTKIRTIKRARTEIVND